MPTFKFSLGMVLIFTVSLAKAAQNPVKPPAKMPSVTCENEETCTIKIPVSKGLEQSYDLSLDQETFTQDANIRAFGSVFKAQKYLTTKRYRSRGAPKFWGTASLEGKGKVKILISGVFLTPNDGIIEWKTEKGVLTQALSPSSIESDVALSLPSSGPSGTPAIPKVDTSPDSNLKDSFLKNSSSNEPLSTPSGTPWGTITPFYPGCYMGDVLEHLLKVSIVVDLGMYTAVTSGTTTPAAALAKVMAAVEADVSVARMTYLAQLNTTIQIQEIVVGTAQSPLPLSRGGATCTNALGALSEITAWNNNEHPGAHNGVWMLLSNCFSGITGVAYIGAYASSWANAAVASNNWLVFAHELGHTIGAQHTFQNGVGTTGGIMDYSNGMYNGIVQFHPANRLEICPTLDYLSQQLSPSFPVLGSGTCGDGVLGPSEQCECLASGSQKCGACVGCKLTKKVSCSSSLFVMRYPDSPEYVAVGPNALSDSKCCNAKGKLARPKTLCNNGLDACSTDGKCTSICTHYLLTNNKNCGFDSSGCLQGCIWEGKCRFDLTLPNPDGSTSLLSEVPDGTSCFLSKTKLGTCQNAVCTPPTPTAP